MNKNMEQMISNDLGISINRIRKESWSSLEKLSKKRLERAFRPQNMFIVGGNINLAENRTMRNHLLEIRNTYRRAMYRTKCLMKGKMHE